MNDLQTALVRELYKVRKSGVNLTYPVVDERLEEIVNELLTHYRLSCKVKPRVQCKQNKRGGRLEYTSAIIEMILVYISENDGHESSPIKITLFLDSYINKNDEPEYGISGEYRNRFKEAIYRPLVVKNENDIKRYVANILNDIAHTTL